MRFIGLDTVPALPQWGYLSLAAGLIVIVAVVMRRRVA